MNGRPKSGNTLETVQDRDYDTMDCINLRPKADEWPALSAARNQTKKSNEETKNKNRDAQKKRSSDKVRGVSPEAGRESMVGKLCERGRS